METSNVTVRKGSDFDIPFALELSPVLAGVAVLPWCKIHSLSATIPNKLSIGSKVNWQGSPI